MPATSADKLDICNKHFHPSFLIKENDRTCLKCGASSTMHLIKFIATNEGYEEIQGLPRISGITEDVGIVNERDAKIMVNEVTPSHHLEHASIISLDER